MRRQSPRRYAHPVRASLERRVSTPDGRVLRVVEAGDPNGRVVLFHHGSPGCGDPYSKHVEDALRRGIRLIGYDRPGYGESNRHQGYAIADTAADVRAIAGALGVDRLAVWGMSAGGPHALASAALLPDLVVAAATLASPAPYGTPGFDYFTGMGQANVDEVRLMLEDEAAAWARLPADRADILGLTPETLAKGMETLISDADAAAHNAEFSEWLVSGMHKGLQHTGDGWWDDSVASLRPWGFDVGSIRIPFQLWHGRQDRFVPFQHGEWLASRIPDVDAHITDEDGHGTLVQHRVPEMHQWLIAHFD
jgi:pimeloyl-ACP methyl ester carboxylesterase